MRNIRNMFICLTITTILTACHINTLPVSKTSSNNKPPQNIVRIGFTADFKSQELALLGVDSITSNKLTTSVVNPALAFSYTAGATNTGSCGLAATNPTFDSVAKTITVDFCFLNQAGLTFDAFDYRQHVPLTSNVTSSSHNGSTLPLSTTADTWIAGQTNFDDGGDSALSIGEATIPQTFVINYSSSGATTFYIDVLAKEIELLITGVIDGPLPRGRPKAVELYAASDIPDLSVYGIGSANNGGGSDGQEFTLSGSASKGSYIYIATESSQFTDFFGFAPTFTHGIAMNINGNDAIELFKNGTVVDVFGDINTNGTGEPWEHLDGWTYRKSATGTNPSFHLANWTFSGINALDGESTNASAASPFPTGTYTP